MSIDELVAFLNDTRKVEIALQDVCGADQSWGFDLCARFEYLAADRNKALHAGAVVKERYARDHMVAVRAIRQYLLRNKNIERIRNNQEPVSAIKTLSELLGKDPNAELSRLLGLIETSGTSITLWSMRHHPLGVHKKDSEAALVFNENRLDIYLRSNKAKIDEDAEKELIRMIVKHDLMQAGWPCAAVNERNESGKLDLLPLNWEAYRMIAGFVTDTILGLVEVDRRLREAGFNVRKEVEIGIKELTNHISLPDFKAPERGELEFYRLAICMTVLQLSGIEGEWHLTPTLDSRVNSITHKVQGLTRRCRELRWEPSRTAATLMLVMLSELGLFDTVGVSEGPKREIRTKFTDLELRILKDLEHEQTES